MAARCRIAILLLALSPTVGAEPVAFDRDVAPILVRHCTDCHSGTKPRGGLDLTRADRAGKVIVPGKLADSPLWQVIDEGKMPPKKPLPEAARKILRAWIEQGAKWGTDPLDPLAFTTDVRAGKNWWSLQPLRRIDLPEVKDSAMVRNAVDRFVLARLEKAGRTLDPEADRRTLLRRLSFDLIGMPPTMDEVTAFVNDPRPDAYERQVDRLLASPAYGERWARHWLDIVRYGESNGFERDLPRENAWPYRDWVIESLNRDLPYDQFARLQLAGDVLLPDNLDGVRATGFLVAGAHDTVVPVVERMRRTMQQDELEDLLGAVGQTFLGLTVNCARCHDHKFDPIAARDYYALTAVFGGVGHGERPLPARPNDSVGRTQRLTQELTELVAPAQKAILARRPEKKTPTPLPTPLAEWDLRESMRDRRGEMHLTLVESARRDATGLILDGTGFAQSPALPVAIAAKTLEVRVRLANLDQRAGGLLTLQALDGGIFDGIVFAERDPKQWISGSNFFQRTQSVRGDEEKDAVRETAHIAVTYATDGTIAMYRNGKPYGQPYRSTGPVKFEAGKSRILLGLRHSPAGGNKHLVGTIQTARLYDRALSADEVAATAGVASDFVSETELLAELTPPGKVRRRELLAAIAEIERERASRPNTTKMYAAVPGTLGQTHLLLRGNVAEPGEAVAPGAVPSVRVPGFTEALAPGASEGQRRAWFARWLTHRDNPLFPRVIVNRLWQYHLGTGLIETTSDFGFNGGLGTDPALLDWLAGELLAHDYRLKPLHRLMVTSAAYRQRVAVDRPVQRLDAEVIRDAMLASAGLLDRRMGGPGYLDVKSYFFKGTQFYDPLEQVGPAFNRRTVYRFNPRGGRSPWLESFDCPDPSTATPRRARTTTPLQALAQLNNAAIFYIADQLAERVGDEPTLDGRVTALVRRLYQRSPRAEEMKSIRAFAEIQGLAALARVLLNSNEFLHGE